MAKILKTVGDEDRKKEILDAALYCFLQFGYSKTSMDDIAKKAELSRPLLYLKFKNKEDLFESIFDFTLEGRYVEADKVLKEKLPPNEKLFRICELILIEPWAKIEGHPKTDEFYEACSKLSPKSTEKYERQIRKYAHAVLGDKEAAETFYLSLEGLSADLPKLKTLTKRVRILVDRFSR
ncbi:TetR/AcrR family transcriptional regulator [Leptospira langatensis]|uniref:TetR/AcrR family transcriptional regulator n=1 Tax=Leptospira langatensis TaxID=2484983 RepID=A0A5F2A0I9_9LEPT|nr:TetR/AcrR family transcriptional regulator [Leptospira langatensis]TGJ98446.1 TetR/AcrR family transcriptional regulator [Leptospira langatensis]TGL43823.1 TetR/AcrR family transcriptional regulator [Leptospira langatensis]